MDFSNKVVLVTGSSRGLGKEIIKEFSSLNATVVINYNNSMEEAKRLQEEIAKDYNNESLLIKADVSKEEEVKEMIEKIISEYGKLDILINNAAIAIDTTFEDKTVDNFRKTLDINLIGPFITSKYASKYMKKNKYGKIINISSTNGIDTYYPESMDYDASKAGLISLTHNLAEELKPYINVNCVAPGWINTDMNKELSTEFIEKEKEKIILNRFADPKEIAKVVVFLASDNASYINSTVIRVDGGKR